MNLASKYRPSSFDDVSDQEYVKTILSKLCKQENLPNRNILLIGLHGTGKTTMARIMANELNDGIGSPIELDAASNGSIEAIRGIVEQAKQYPIGQKYKVFIIDECHSLSNQAWQVLLLTLEAQPAKSVFIFLTTNPEKIPSTILSRIQVFHLDNISVDGIRSRLQHIIESEVSEGRSITYDDAALTYLAKRGKGSMRDAITLLDKALVYSDDVTMENLKVALRIPAFDDYFELLNAYASNDHDSIVRIVSRVNDSGVDMVNWMKDFQAFAVNLAKFVFMKDLSKTIIPAYYQDQVSKYDENHARVCLKLSQTLIPLIDTASKTEYVEETAIAYLCR